MPPCPASTLAAARRLRGRAAARQPRGAHHTRWHAGDSARNRARRQSRRPRRARCSRFGAKPTWPADLRPARALRGHPGQQTVCWAGSAVRGRSLEDGTARHPPALHRRRCSDVWRPRALSRASRSRRAPRIVAPDTDPGRGDPGRPRRRRRGRPGPDRLGQNRGVRAAARSTWSSPSTVCRR